MTDTDAKEWVTVKVPKADREQANDYRPDGVTYGECLVAGAERLNDSLDSDNGRFKGVVRPAANTDDTPDTDALGHEVARQLDYTALASKVAEELEGRLR